MYLLLLIGLIYCSISDEVSIGCHFYRTTNCLGKIRSNTTFYYNHDYPDYCSNGNEFCNYYQAYANLSTNEFGVVFWQDKRCQHPYGGLGHYPPISGVFSKCARPDGNDLNATYGQSAMCQLINN